MGVPPFVLDPALLREHAYFDSGNLQYVIPDVLKEKLGYINIQDRGLGSFDYCFAMNSTISTAKSISPIYILAIASMLFFVATFIFVFFSGKYEKNFIAALPLMQQLLLLIVQLLVLVLTEYPPSLTNTPDLSDVESFEPSPIFKFDTLHDGFNSSLKNWTTNDLDRVHVMV